MYNQRTKNSHTIKIAIFGKEGVAKSHIFSQFFPHAPHNEKNRFSVKIYPGQPKVNFEIIESDSLTPQLIQQAHIYLYVFDLTDPNSYQNEFIKPYIKAPVKPLFIVGTNKDKPHSWFDPRENSYRDHQYSIKTLLISHKSNEIRQLLTEIADATVFALPRLLKMYKAKILVNDLKWGKHSNYDEHQATSFFDPLLTFLNILLPGILTDPVVEAFTRVPFGIKALRNLFNIIDSDNVEVYALLNKEIIYPKKLNAGHVHGINEFYQHYSNLVVALHEQASRSGFETHTSLNFYAHLYSELIEKHHNKEILQQSALTFLQSATDNNSYVAQLPNELLEKVLDHVAKESLEDSYQAKTLVKTAFAQAFSENKHREGAPTGSSSATL